MDYFFVRRLTTIGDRMQNPGNGQWGHPFDLGNVA